jgi:hypothetical protein
MPSDRAQLTTEPTLIPGVIAGSRPAGNEIAGTPAATANDRQPAVSGLSRINRRTKLLQGPIWAGRSLFHRTAGMLGCVAPINDFLYVIVH